MKLPVVNNRAKRCRRRTLAGQILAEAAIGLSLIVFTWIVVTYVNYMCNNRIRTNMAARFSAWLSGNGANANANGSLPANFFVSNDTKLVKVASTKNTLSLLGVNVPSIILPTPYIYSNSVAFGTNISASAPFPFDTLSVNVPFMPMQDLLTNFTMVQAHCAWPDVSDTYNGYIPPSITALAAAEVLWEAGMFTQ
jgi:hypothetical protein